MEILNVQVVVVNVGQAVVISDNLQEEISEVSHQEETGIEGPTVQEIEMGAQTAVLVQTDQDIEDVNTTLF